MIRLISGDLTLWTDAPSPCGRTYPRLPNGIFGRIDDMFTIRGENVYPSEIDAALNQVSGYGGEHRIVITRDGQMDELLLRVEPTPELERQGGEALAAFRDVVTKRIQTMLGLRAAVEVPPSGTFPRTDFKARRVIDDRDAFRELNQRLGAERP
jgi:phenylacetate-CoA ligase